MSEGKKMKLLKVTDRYGRISFVSQEDYEKFQPKGFLIPLRYKTGRKFHDMPRGLRPKCTMITPLNIVKVEEFKEITRP